MRQKKWEKIRYNRKDGRSGGEKGINEKEKAGKK